MERTRFAFRAGAVGGALAAAALAGVMLIGVPARADVDVRIDFGNAPPAPRIVFRVRPHEQYYRDYGVYVVDDDDLGDNDCFRYGGYYWVFRDGFWYRSRGWRGRFVAVHPRYVPAVFYRMPPERWKHHPNGPPGLEKKRDRMPPGQEKKRDRDRHGDDH